MGVSAHRVVACRLLSHSSTPLPIMKVDKRLKVGKVKKKYFFFAVPLFYTCLDNLASHGSHFSYCHPKMGLSSFWCWKSQKCHLLSDHPLPMLCWSDICWLNAFKTKMQ